MTVIQQQNALDARAIQIEDGIRTFPEAWKRFLNPAQPGKVVDLNGSPAWPKRYAEDGRIESGWSKHRIVNMIRAMPLHGQSQQF